MIKDLKNWVEATRGLFRYVIAASVCYEFTWSIIIWIQISLQQHFN